MTPSQLRAIRQRLGWSQDVAATALGLSERSYRYTEAGTKSHGKPLDSVPASIAIAMLAHELIADMKDGPIPSSRVERFGRAVKRESGLPDD
jgi:DNA-binding XRE family transcriptional regulator